MSAATGNTYAEKWTLERTLRTLATIDQLSQDNSYLYLGQVLSAVGTYDDVWRYWRSKWRRRAEILDLMKQIMQRFESRIFVKMANKEMPDGDVCAAAPLWLVSGEGGGYTDGRPQLYRPGAGERTRACR